MRVLVVEDDAAIAAAIRRSLRAVNVVGDVASTSRDACAMLADTTYHVVVLDVMLPDQDGFATCRHVRSIGDWTPIIMVSPPYQRLRVAAADGVYPRVAGDVAALEWIRQRLALDGDQARAVDEALVALRVASDGRNLAAAADHATRIASLVRDRSVR